MSHCLLETVTEGGEITSPLSAATLPHNSGFVTEGVHPDQPSRLRMAGCGPSTHASSTQVVHSSHPNGS